MPTIVMVTWPHSGAIMEVPPAFSPSLMMKLKNTEDFDQLLEKVRRGEIKSPLLPP